LSVMRHGPVALSLPEYRPSSARLDRRRWPDARNTGDLSGRTLPRMLQTLFRQSKEREGLWCRRTIGVPGGAANLWRCYDQPDGGLPRRGSPGGHRELGRPGLRLERVRIPRGDRVRRLVPDRAFVLGRRYETARGTEVGTSASTRRPNRPMAAIHTG
jgi:hypothetical protein